MIRLRRFVRRNKKKLCIYLSLLSLANSLVPHPAAAQFPLADTAERPVAVMTEQPSPPPSPPPDRPLLPSPENLPVKRSVHVMATAYSSSRDETDGDPFTTASGAKVRDGVIAANGLPFGTRLRIPDVYGDKIFTVLDRMSARYGCNRIDIWMPTKQEAMDWGVRYVRAEIL